MRYTVLAKIVKYYDGMVVFTKGTKVPKPPIHYYGGGNSIEETLSAHI